jgi:hypothetical protein
MSMGIEPKISMTANKAKLAEMISFSEKLEILNSSIMRR